MMKAASVRVTVDFTGKKRPEGYVVKISPEGGDVVGSHGGSGNIDAKDQMNFEYLPPGRYFLSGRPNPNTVQRRITTVSAKVFFRRGRCRCSGRFFFHFDIFRLIT